MNTALDTTRQLIERCTSDAHAGTRSFGEIVMQLAQAGIEGYYVDYRAESTTYYLPDGGSHRSVLQLPKVAIADDFAKDKVVQAIRGAQSGAVKYPEFLQLTLQAGCVGYHVWISGRHVVYYGRRGEQHVEMFP